MGFVKDLPEVAGSVKMPLSSWYSFFKLYLGATELPGLQGLLVIGFSQAALFQQVQTGSIEHPKFIASGKTNHLMAKLHLF